MKTRKIDFWYRLRWPWLYLQGKRPSQRPYHWVSSKMSEAQDADLELVFMGDLLGMGDQPLEFSRELKTWIGRPDFLVFNLEAQIHSGQHLPLLKQSFKDNCFFQALKKDFSHSKLIAGVANNHFHDFSEV